MKILCLLKWSFYIALYHVLICGINAQQPFECYKVLNEYISLKTSPGTQKYLYYMAGECGLFDKKDSFIIKKTELKSQFKYLTDGEKRIKLIDSLFSQFDVNYMREQAHLYKKYKWNKYLLKNNISLFKKPKELKTGNEILGLSVPVFINSNNDWAFIQDYQDAVVLFILMKKNSDRWSIVEEYIRRDSD